MSDEDQNILDQINNFIDKIIGKEEDEEPFLDEPEHEEQELDITIKPFTARVSDEILTEDLYENQKRVGFGIEIEVDEDEWTQISGAKVVHGMLYDTNSDVTIEDGDKQPDNISEPETFTRNGKRVIRHWIDTRIIESGEEETTDLEYNASGSALAWIWTTEQDVHEADIEQLQLDVNSGSEKELADELKNYITGNPNIPDFAGHLRTPTIKKIEFDQNHTAEI